MKYRKYSSYFWLIIGLSCLLLVLMTFSLQAGHVAISFGEVVSGLLGSDEGAASIIVREIRVPRTILAVFIGAMLAVSGAVLQG